MIDVVVLVDECLRFERVLVDETLDDLGADVVAIVHQRLKFVIEQVGYNRFGLGVFEIVCILVLLLLLLLGRMSRLGRERGMWHLCVFRREGARRRRKRSWCSRSSSSSSSSSSGGRRRGRDRRGGRRRRNGSILSKMCVLVLLLLLLLLLVVVSLATGAARVLELGRFAQRAVVAAAQLLVGQRRRARTRTVHFSAIAVIVTAVVGGGGGCGCGGRCAITCTWLVWLVAAVVAVDVVTVMVVVMVVAVLLVRGGVVGGGGGEGHCDDRSLLDRHVYQAHEVLRRRWLRLCLLWRQRRLSA